MRPIGDHGTDLSEHVAGPGPQVRDGNPYDLPTEHGQSAIPAAVPCLSRWIRMMGGTVDLDCDQ